MGKKTRIDWCDATWNPVTGCLHGCEYCYARRIAERFGGASETHNNECCHECQWLTEAEGKIHELDVPIYDVDNSRNAPYPFEFDPTFHRYRLDEPQHWKKPRTIFVCSMADLFGNWVPDEWIGEVFKACEKARQHRYLFLTKNPARYDLLYNVNGIESLGACRAMLGFTIDKAHGRDWYEKQDRYSFVNSRLNDKFVSIEPITQPLSRWDLEAVSKCAWVIVGAETGSRKGKVIPDRNWVLDIAELCCINGIPIFMKESLRGLMGAEFRQEFPWDNKT